MILRDFSRSFFNLCAKPKNTDWQLKVIEHGTQKVLCCDWIGDERHAVPGTFDREIIKWWIEYKTVYVLVVQKKSMERMISVTDDWYPCFENGQVRLRLSMNYFKGYYIILSAWGADDTGVEISVNAEGVIDAEQKFNSLLELYHFVPDGVDRKWFFDHGFVRA